MTRNDDTTIQALESRAISEETQPTRRDFLAQSLVATTGLALTGLLPDLLPGAVTEAAQAPAACPPTTANPALATAPELASQGGKLQAVVRIKGGDVAVPGLGTRKLRYFDGYNWAAQPPQPPTGARPLAPGPTLRAEVGDTVEIGFFNEVDVAAFPGTLDVAEQGKGCNTSALVAGGGTGNPTTTTSNQYPGNFDNFPNCFHASSTANLHFHGTHVTPQATGDNILVGIRPNPKLNEQALKELFQGIFKAFENGNNWQNWAEFQQVPEAATWWGAPGSNQTGQRKLLSDYDQNAPYQGQFGLPPSAQLLPQDDLLIRSGEWPQWYIGSYPYCYKIPKYTVNAQGQPTGPVMGQAPGTHWYHAHKHGSTALNLFNGLAGAFIISDNSPTGYDGKLKSFYQTTYNWRLKETLLMFQEITDSINLLGVGGPRALLVNGQNVPTVTLQPGEVQLWRLINATVSKTLTPTFLTSDLKNPAPISFRQTAQDGVQLSWTNYSTLNQPNQTAFPTGKMAPANRVDVLVQAPVAPGCYVLANGGAALLRINVAGTPVTMGFPSVPRDYPPLPPFLQDLDPNLCGVRRTIKYAWEAGRQGVGRNPATNAPPSFTIDGQKFSGEVSHTMMLNAVEEWTITNYSGVAHPFHIHQNPFQIFEVFDPTQNGGKPVVIPGNFVWWDTFAIPAGQSNGDGTYTPGYFKMRTRFADFTGQFVNHCHILGHEDRGMMQLLQVIPTTTLKKHH